MCDVWLDRGSGSGVPDFGTVGETINYELQKKECLHMLCQIMLAVAL